MHSLFGLFTGYLNVTSIAVGIAAVVAGEECPMKLPRNKK